MAISGFSARVSSFRDFPYSIAIHYSPLSTPVRLLLIHSHWFIAYMVPRHADDRRLQVAFPVLLIFICGPFKFIFHPLHLIWCPDTLTEDLFRRKFKNSIITLPHSFHFSTSSTYHPSQSKPLNPHSRSKTYTHEIFPIITTFSLSPAALIHLSSSIHN